MTSQLLYSKRLSLKLKRESAFKSILFPEYYTYAEIETGIKVARNLKDHESILSCLSDNKSDNEIDKLEEIRHIPELRQTF